MMDEGQLYEGSNPSADLMPVLMPRKSIKSTRQLPSIDERVGNLKHELITEISIITPRRVRPENFNKELLTYRYERVQKSLFSDKEAQSLREQQTLISAMNSLFMEFKKVASNRFYLIYGNQNYLYFSHDQNKKDGSSIVISSRGGQINGELNKEGIQYTTLHVEELNRDKLLITKRQAAIFWGYLVNSALSKNFHLEVVSSFSFMFAQHFMPIEMYNGSENRKNFAQLAQANYTDFGQLKPELFLMRLEGFWLPNNLKNLVDSLRSKFGPKFEIEFQTNSYCCLKN